MTTIKEKILGWLLHAPPYNVKAGDYLFILNGENECLVLTNMENLKNFRPPMNLTIVFREKEAKNIERGEIPEGKND